MSTTVLAEPTGRVSDETIRSDRPRRRVLMICFAYPPVGGAGMIRPAKFAKYLPQLGYDPIVLTPSAGAGRIPCDPALGEVPGATIYRTGYSDIVDDVRRVLHAGRPREATRGTSRPRSGVAVASTGRAASWRRALSRMAYEAVTLPDEHVGWTRPALEAARALLAREPVDVIYSTSPPETAHLIARTLKREFGIPWVADLRDLWSGDHYRQRSAVKRWVLERIERRTLGEADALVTVSEPWRRDLAHSYEAAPRRVVCIPHGFDADDYPVGVGARTDHFTITYTGSLDRDFQDPGPFLAVLGELVSRGAIDRDRVRVDFHVFGDNVPDLDALAERHGLSGVVRRLPPLEYRACLAAQQASTVLLVLQWHSEAGKGNPPLKAYDYLGSRRPILVVGSGEAVLGPLLKDTAAGVVARSRAELASALVDWYGEFRQTGRVQCRSRHDTLAPYTRRAQATKLADVFESVIRATHHLRTLQATESQ